MIRAYERRRREQRTEAVEETLLLGRGDEAPAGCGEVRSEGSGGKGLARADAASVVASWEAKALESDVGAIRVEQHAVIPAAFGVDLQSFVNGTCSLSRDIWGKVLEHIIEA